MEGLRALPTTSAAKSWPMPCAQPPTATMAMAQPSTETPALRFESGAPRPAGNACTAEPFASAELRGCMTGAAKQRDAAAACGRRSGAKRAVRTAWRSAMAFKELFYFLGFYGLGGTVFL